MKLLWQDTAKAMAIELVLENAEGRYYPLHMCSKYNQLHVRLTIHLLLIDVHLELHIKHIS